MLPKDFKISSFMTPVISTMDGETYVCPGWHKIPKETTIEEVLQVWTQELPKITEINPTEKIEEYVKSSNGKKKYKVIFDNGMWDCTCVGFSFRRTCKHIDQIKKLYHVKKEKIT